MVSNADQVLRTDRSVDRKIGGISKGRARTVCPCPKKRCLGERTKQREMARNGNLKNTNKTKTKTKQQTKTLSEVKFSDRNIHPGEIKTPALNGELQVISENHRDLNKQVGHNVFFTGKYKQRCRILSSLLNAF